MEGKVDRGWCSYQVPTKLLNKAPAIGVDGKAAIHYTRIMELNDYIQQAREQYPNGYSDYINKYPTDTIDLWLSIYKDTEREVNGFLYNKSELSIMDMWDKDKLWTFLGEIEYYASQILSKE
jgi:hypothetical protein